MRSRKPLMASDLTADPADSAPVIQRATGLGEEVYQAIFRRLMALKVPPGARITVDGLAREFNVSQTPVREALSRLESEGLVERHQCQVDGRNNVVVITSKGRALRRAMWPVYAAAIEEQFAARLTQAEAEQLAKLLTKVGPE